MQKNTPYPTLSQSHQMIDAKNASAAMHLPHYWFANPLMRKRYRIPHYRLGGSVRYRHNELLTWAQRSRALSNSSSPCSSYLQEIAQ